MSLYNLVKKKMAVKGSIEMNFNEPCISMQLSILLFTVVVFVRQLKRDGILGRYSD